MVEFDKGSIKSQEKNDVHDHDVQADDDCDKFNASRAKQVKFEGNEVLSIDPIKSGEKNNKSPRASDNSIDNYFGYREALKSEITSVANNTSITSNALSLPFLASIVHEGFQFEQFEGCSSLTKQYNSATSVLQNFSTSRPFMETSNNKFIENNNNNNILFSKYFPLSDFPTSLLPNKHAVSTSNYPFAAPSILPSNYSSIPNLVSSKSSSAFQQFPPSFFPSIMSSGFTTLGTNSYSSSMNAQNCFNSKLGLTDNLNNNFMYTSNFFSGIGANKLASYPYTQGSTHIYPPFINSNIFSPNTIPNVLGSSLNQVIPNSAYNNDTMMSGESNTMQSTGATEVTDSSFSPTMPCVNNVHSQHDFESRMQFESSSYNGIYCDLNQSSTEYSNVKQSRKKSKQQLSVKKNLKSKKNLNNELNHNIKRVFIWDLDDVIIALHSLVTGEYSTRFGKDSSSTASLGLRVEEYIYDLCVTFLFYNDLEEYDPIHIDDASVDDNGQDISDYSFETDGFNNNTSNNAMQFSTNGRRGLDWMRKLAYRYRRIREIYDSYRNNIEEIISLNKRDQWVPLIMELEQITDSWHTLAYKSLNIIYRRPNCVNVLVTNTHLVQSISKCLLFKLGNFFPIENVYSASKPGKEACFQRIQTRFGTKCTYVVIGSGRDEEIASKQKKKKTKNNK